MKTEHDFFEEFIDSCITEDDMEQIHRIYNLIDYYLSTSQRDSLFQQAPIVLATKDTRYFLKDLKTLLNKETIIRLKATLLHDDRFTPQEVRDKSWEFEQEYKDKELDLDEIGGDLDEYTTRIVNECYRPPQKYDEE